MYCLQVLVLAKTIIQNVALSNPVPGTCQERHVWFALYVLDGKLDIVNWHVVKGNVIKEYLIHLMVWITYTIRPDSVTYICKFCYCSGRSFVIIGLSASWWQGSTEHSKRNGNSWDLAGHFEWRHLINENVFKIFNNHRNFAANNVKSPILDAP